jgi:hypothetical protein
MNDTTKTSSDYGSASGRFVLRINPGLHAALRQNARDAGISLNELCARKLGMPLRGFVGPGENAVAKAAGLLGDALLGVVGFGSWARLELAQESDVDLLVIIDDEVGISRQLYRDWDEAPVFWNGHPVEPHFVNLPRPGATFSGTWAEVALDGVILFERELLVSRLLMEIRHKIVSGHIVRRRLHGQSYWVEAA